MSLSNNSNSNNNNKNNSINGKKNNMKRDSFSCHISVTGLAANHFILLMVFIVDLYGSIYIKLSINLKFDFSNVWPILRFDIV